LHRVIKLAAVRAGATSADGYAHHSPDLRMISDTSIAMAADLQKFLNDHMGARPRSVGWPWAGAGLAAVDTARPGPRPREALWPRSGLLRFASPRLHIRVRRGR
jgi:hypothetical protein